MAAYKTTFFVLKLDYTSQLSKHYTPPQVYFSVPHTNDGDRIVSLLREQVHNGDLSGTLKITDSGNQYDIRINV